MSKGVSKQSNEHSGAHEQSKQCGASKQVSGASEWRSEWPSSMSGFLVILDHSGIIVLEAICTLFTLIFAVCK